MADELQALLDKINSEGVKKAEQQQQAILEEAKREAAHLIAAAREQAAAIVSNAENNAALLEQKGKEALRQAERDIVLSLRNDLRRRVAQCASELMQETLSGEPLADIVASVIRAYIDRNGNCDDLSVLLPEKRRDLLEKALRKRLGDSLKQDGTLEPARGLAAGFKISFNGGNVLFDFSDQALADALASYVGPHITAALRDGSAHA